MKTLFLVRHAKSSWEEPGVSDLMRTILPRGAEKTELIVDFLRKRAVFPDRIVSSPACRALETANIVAEGLRFPVGNIITDKRIYEGLYDRILDLIGETPDEVGSLMIFGHNPTITQVANLFLHPGIDNMPTSCVVCINFETGSWNSITGAVASEGFTVFPKMLRK